MIKDLKTKIIRTSVLLLLTIVFLINCAKTDYNTKRYYTTQTGKCVTIWDNFIVFEKYEEKQPPKENYIKLNHNTPYIGCTHVFFKQGNKIVVLRQSNDSVEVVFDSKYNIETLHGWGNWPHYYDICSMDDTLAIADYYFHEWRGALWPTFFEAVGDSVYVTNYHDKGNFLFRIVIREDTVVSRYDECLTKRDPY